MPSAPQGRLTLAVEERLVALFQRSFPQAVVGAHGTLKVDHHVVRGARFVEDARMAEFDLWAPMASPLRRFRRTVADFPERRAFPEARFRPRRPLARRAGGRGPRAQVLG